MSLRLGVSAQKKNSLFLFPSVSQSLVPGPVFFLSVSIAHHGLVHILLLFAWALCIVVFLCCSICSGVFFNFKKRRFVLSLTFRFIPLDVAITVLLRFASSPMTFSHTLSVAALFLVFSLRSSCMFCVLLTKLALLVRHFLSLPPPFPLPLLLSCPSPPHL